MRSLVAPVAVWAGIAACTLHARDAFADDSPADVAAARQLGIEGFQLADAGKCGEALEKLDRAERLHHAPTTAERLGECHIEVGHLVAGTEVLQRLLREQLPPGSPPAFSSAMDRARKLLPTALPRIGKLHIVVSAPPGTKYKVTIDGQPLSDAAIDVDRPTDPGNHAIEATAPGFLAASQKITLKDADSQRVALTLEPDPNAPKTPPPTAAVEPTPGGPVGSDPNAGSGTGNTTPPPDAGARPQRSKAGAYVAFALGGVGLVVGGITGAIAVGKASSLDKDCPDKTCPPDQVKQSDIDSARAMGTISTVGFVVGGVGIVTGIVLLVAASSGSGSASASTAASASPKSPKSHAATKPKTISNMQPVVGDRYLGLSLNW